MVFIIPLVASRLGWQVGAVLLGMGLALGIILKYAPVPAWKPRHGEVFPVRETPVSAIVFVVVWVGAALALAMVLKSRFGW